MAINTTKYDHSYKEVLDKQMSLKSGAPKVNSGGAWISAARNQVNTYLNPGNSSTGVNLYQHMLLSYRTPISAITVTAMNNYLKGKRVLTGQGQAFLTAANTYKVNPIYLAMHASLETGNGTSKLATGKVPGYSGYYNVYGIGANDGTAEASGAKYAKKQGWNSVSKAIIGGAKFVAESYIALGQDTLYRMRWNPKNPGSNQYATDIAWASKIASRLKSTADSMGLSQSSLNFNISVYRDSSYTPVKDSKGHKIIEEAKKHLGKPYVFGANGPSSFDCSGYIKYVFNKAINYGMSARTAFTQEKLGKKVNNNSSMAGDLVFFENTYNSGNTPNISHVGIMLGDGDKFINASGNDVNISSLSSWKSSYYSTKRLLDESETFSEGSMTGDYISDSAIDTITGLAGGLPLSKVNEYVEELQNALDLLDKSKNSYCSLIDLTHGGEFKFYLSDSFVESLPVSWDMGSSILGRSTPVVGYNSSGPRSIPLDITLMVGAGYYSIAGKTHDQIMDIMYKDINFVRSMSYPDYNSTIVQPPSVVLLSCGANVKLKGILTGVNVTYNKPFDLKNRAMKVNISFTVSQVSDEPPGYSDIRANNIRSY